MLLHLTTYTLMMLRKAILLFLLVLVTIVAQAQLVIPLKKYAGKLKYVDVSMGGKNYKFLFDSGGGQTIISPALAQALGKVPYGRSVGFRMSGEKVEFEKCDSVSLTIAGQVFSHPEIAVWDIMSVLPKELPPIDGLISLKTFANDVLTIDLPNNQLIVETKKSYRKKIKIMQLLNSRFPTGLEGSELSLFLGIPHSGKTWWFLFDTANLDRVTLAPTTAKAWNLKLNDNDERQELGNLDFILASKTLTAPAAVRSIIYDGALSYELISQAVYTVSFPEKKVWLGAPAK